MQDAMTELLAEFGCDAAQGRVMDAAELREQADMVAEQQAEVLKEKLAAERPVPEETLSFYVAECLEFTFAGEFHDHLTMEEALEAYQQQSMGGFLLRMKKKKKAWKRRSRWCRIIIIAAVN